MSGFDCYHWNEERLACGLAAPGHGWVPVMGWRVEIEHAWSGVHEATPPPPGVVTETDDDDR